MTFERTAIAEVATVRSGYSFKSRDWVDSGVPVVKIANVKSGWITLDGCSFVNEAIAHEAADFELHPGDILISMTGHIGEVAKVRSEGRMLLNQRVGKFTVRDRTRLDPDYLYYCLQQSDLKDSMIARAYGVAQPNISPSLIEQHEIPLPPLPVQQRIAGILSAYDELMDNSQRRIHVLGAIARAIYREWFVHLRFPGHATLPRVASPLGDMPQGWAVQRLDEVCRSVQDGDWIETKDQGGKDYRLLQISNVGLGEFIETGNYRFVSQATFERLRCTQIKPGDILVARMPTPIGRAWLATAMPWRMITAVDVAIIRAHLDVLHPLFLAQAWNEPFNLQRIAAQASGTTRLRITRRELAALEFLVPPVELQLQFTRFAEPLTEMMQALRLQIRNVRRTRDLLLPRLLSGQIELDTKAA